eukprot:10105970-Alexandrium_andersonii.AAC.1
MSASLVGSEMCIRDRPTASAGRNCRRKRKRSRTLLRREGGEAAQPPVSYTHLTLPTICSV